jgi:hypothetical protein
MQEEQKEKINLDWADEMEQKDLAQTKAQAAALEAKKFEDPTKDPENVKWMEEQMKIHKEQFGETFGENIEENFE